MHRLQRTAARFRIRLSNRKGRGRGETGTWVLLVQTATGMTPPVNCFMMLGRNSSLRLIVSPSNSCNSKGEVSEGRPRERRSSKRGRT